MIEHWMKPLAEEQADKASKYWMARVNGMTWDNGDRAGLGEYSSMASMMSGMLFQKPSPEALKAFGERLREVLLNREYWNLYHFDGRRTGVDYGPHYILREIARETGVCEHNFPWKTWMLFEDGAVSIMESSGDWGKI